MGRAVHLYTLTQEKAGDVHSVGASLNICDSGWGKTCRTSQNVSLYDVSLYDVSLYDVFS